MRLRPAQLVLFLALAAAAAALITAWSRGVFGTAADELGPRRIVGLVALVAVAVGVMVLLVLFV